MKQILLFAVIALTGLTSCNDIFSKPVRGNGHIITETRTPGAFKNVSVSGNINIYVTQDSVPGVKVVADENLMKYIAITSDGNTLEVHPRDNYNLHASNEAIKVFVSGKDFSHFSASGACDIFSTNQVQSTGTISYDLSGACDVTMDVQAPKVEAEMSGAGSIKLKGSTRDFKVSGSGSTDVKCYDLLAENTTIEISGAGDAQVFASVKLDVHVSGAGTVKYKGNATVSQEVSGAGSVKKVE